MTPGATAELLAALKRLQLRSDRIIMDTDWNSLDWAAHGLAGLASPVTAEQKASLCGGCEQQMSPPGSLFPPDWVKFSGFGGQGRAGVSEAPPPGRRFTECPGLPLTLPPGDAERYGGRGFLPTSFPLAYDDHVLGLA